MATVPSSRTSRAAILRDVISAGNARRDGRLPLDVPGAREVFADDLDLLGALQLRWQTRLAGRIERALMEQPMDLEGAVVAAWHRTADELPSVLAIVDRHRAEPTSAEMAASMRRSADKERELLALAAGASGAAIESRARATYRPAHAA